ncbi:MAG: FtsH protease activity modulator HflK [Lachnospiraceae bacterium]|nr:FtsH protease activity modulator HflK [Lachnospiraceae bacterium]
MNQEPVQNDAPGKKKFGFGKKTPKPKKEKASKPVKERAQGILSVIPKIIILLAVVSIAFSTAYSLNEDEDAVITTFGIPSVVEDSGLHFKIPFIQKRTNVDMSVRGMTIGYNPHTDASIENESLMITKDFNFINVDFYVEWQVTDAVAYLFASEDPQTILKTLTMSYIRDTIGSYNIDEVLTTGKAQIQSEIRTKLIERMESEQLGITVRSVAIQDAEPPTAEVSAAFKAVEDAKQKAEETVNNAKTYRNQKIPAAEAQSKTILENAEAQKQTRIREAEGQIARFNAMYEEYIKYPDITKTRMYYEAMEELLPGLKVIIQDGKGNIVNVLGDVNTNETDKD